MSTLKKDRKTVLLCARFLFIDNQHFNQHFFSTKTARKAQKVETILYLSENQQPTKCPHNSTKVPKFFNFQTGVGRQIQTENH